MKKILTFCVLCVFMGNLFAQKPKPSKEKPPTAAEMKKMMADAQNQLDKIDPETKRMMDSMGIKMSSVSKKQMANIEKITDKQIADAYEDANRIVPKKSPAKIAKANTIKLSNENIGNYIQSIHIAIFAKMNAKQKKECEDLLAYVKTQKNNANGIALAASGCMMNNIFYPGLYLMSTACTMEQDNADLLNNYASFLTMSGGAEFAIPILNNLNQRIPNNATILNNLGQAWFCLGAIDVAEKNLSACLSINTNQPQANETMSAIAQSKGNITKAKEFLKRSIKTTYSEEKEVKLKNLGEKLTKNDVSWYLPKKDDGLGLGKIVLPQWPKNIDEVEADGQNWIAFFHQIEDTKVLLKKEGAEIGKQIELEIKKTAAALAKGKRISANIYAKKAHIALKNYSENFNNHFEKNQEKVKAFYNEYRIVTDNYKKQFNAVFKKYEGQYGEGGTNPEAAECAEKIKVVNSYLNDVNSLKEKFFTAEFTNLKVMLNDYLHYVQYTANSQLEFDALKSAIKEFSLQYFIMHIPFEDKIEKLYPMSSDLHDGDCGMVNLTTLDCQKEDNIKDGKAEPINFLVADCPKIELNLYIFSITEQCGRMTGTYHLGPVKLDLEKDANDNSFFTKGSLEISFTDGWKVGEKILEANNKKIEAGALIEFDNTGITDIGIKAEARAEAGTDIYEGLDRKIKLAGIEGKITWNTGATITGGGILEGINVNYK